MRSALVPAIAATALAAGGLATTALAASTTFDAKLKQERIESSGAITQSGTVTGRFGRGTMRTKSVPVDASSSRYTTSSTLRFGGGTIRTRGSMTIRLGRTTFTVSGSARVVGGTGKYKGLQGKLRVDGEGKLDLSGLRLRMAGDVG